jgi:radical SAM-linked protein
MRRAGIPLLYSRGFNPKPKIAFGPALPVGTASEGEYLDFETVSRIEPMAAAEAINRSVQEGLRFLAVAAIRRDVPSLGDTVRSARYRARSADRGELNGDVESFRARGPVRLTREGGKRVRTFDLHREILELDLVEPDTVRFLLAVHPGGASVRPGEVLREIFGSRAERLLLTREDLLVDLEGRRINPLLAASAVRHHERAVR